MAKKTALMLLVKQKTKDYIKTLGQFNVASDYVDALNEAVAYELSEAALRTLGNKRKTVSAKDIYAGKLPKKIPTLVVQSKVREYIKSTGDYNVAGDFLDALNYKVSVLVAASATRAKNNGRKTVQGRDC